MDPNANLAEQRRIIARVMSDRHAVRSGDLQRLAELAEALDEWLTHGGSLPTAWQHPNRSEGFTRV